MNLTGSQIAGPGIAYDNVCLRQLTPAHIIGAMRQTAIPVAVLVLISLCGSHAASARSQAEKPETPVVRFGEMPLYPQLARQARIEGTVRLEVTTDGTGVTKVAASGAHKLLMDAAEQNVRTWKFYKHAAQTFTATFQYKLEKREVSGFVNPIVVLDLPNRVEIRTRMATVEADSMQQ